MKSKTAIEIIDSVLWAFEPEIRNKILDYIDRGYDVCSGRALARGKEWEDESESRMSLFFDATIFKALEDEIESQEEINDME